MPRRSERVGQTPTFTAAGVLLAVGLFGCHETPPSLQMAETASIGSDEAPPPTDEDEPEIDARESTSGRDLWFADGPGREAILARERHDYERAAKLLDELLAREDLSEDDRAAAELLRGLEDLRRDDWMAGADRLAKARTSDALAPIEGALRVLEAQARLDGQDAAGALELVEDLDRLRAVARLAQRGRETREGFVATRLGHGLHQLPARDHRSLRIGVGEDANPHPIELTKLR